MLTPLLILLAAAAVSCTVGQEAASTSAVTQPTHTLLPAPDVSGNGVLWGFVDDKGDWVIEPRFQDASRFHDALAAVRVAGKWGYVDDDGSLVIQPQFTEAFGFEGRLARVATGPAPHPNDRWLLTGSAYGFIDKTGQMVIPAEWDDAGDFSEGLAPVMRGSTCGFIDTQGQVAIPLEFDSVVAFSEGLACAASGGKWGYIDKSGNWAIEPTYEGLVGKGVPEETYVLPVGRFKSGLAPVSVYLDDRGGRIGGGMCQYIDKTGNKAFDLVFYRGGEFSEGLAPVELDKAGGFVWGFIDTSGTLVIEPQFEFPGRLAGIELYLLSFGGFHQGLAAVAKDGKVGYVDQTGSFVIEPQFTAGWGFFDGYAYVCTGDSNGTAVADWTYIDPDGRVIYEDPADSSDTH